jgi:hypothetical protein
MTSVGDDVEELKPSDIAVGHKKMFSSSGKQFGAPSKS